MVFCVPVFPLSSVPVMEGEGDVDDVVIVGLGDGVKVGVAEGEAEGEIEASGVASGIGVRSASGCSRCLRLAICRFFLASGRLGCKRRLFS